MVFSQKVLQQIAKNHASTFKNLYAIETALNKRFVRMSDPIRALILSVASGEPLLFVGPPGTAKSRLIRAFLGYVAINPINSTRTNGGYFEYLLTPFTEPSELFGYYNIAAAMESRKLERDDAGMMQHAQVVYLDEVFNGSSAILNSILAFMNEGIFHDRGSTVPVAMQCMFGATNDVPYTNELRAVYDRFLLRCEVHNIAASPDGFNDLFEAGWVESYGQNGSSGQETFPDLLKQIRRLQAEIRQQTASGNLVPQRDSPFYTKLIEQVHNIRQYEYSEMSNRRLIKLLHVMLLQTLYDAVTTGDISRLELGEKEHRLLRFAIDHWDDEFFKMLEQGL